MLSYRHSYHAGNHADVLKHAILIQLLQHLLQKEKPFWIIDTHAGAGIYSLDSAHAEKLGEFRGGIGRLWAQHNLPPILQEYVDAVQELNGSGPLLAYPGSPWLEQRALREQDKLRLFELHSSDFQLLENQFGKQGRQTIVQSSDGFAGLKALLPPPSRRGLTLIDPSYELSEDYSRLIQALQESLQRFPTGIYAIWYPVLSKPESRQLPHKLKALGCKSWLHASLNVRSPSPEGYGMHGSGMFIINPPWTLATSLKAALPVLVQLLKEDQGACHTLEYETP